jgi:hypothetical protein
MTIDVVVRPIVDVGAVPLGSRRMVVFDGGTFEGRDGLRGTLEPGGVDWQLGRPDGVVEISAHYLLRSDGDEPIEVVSTGLRAASPEVTARLMAGDDVDPSEYYFRTHIRLTTPTPRLAWMNDLLAVSTGERRRGLVRIHVHEVA